MATTKTKGRLFSKAKASAVPKAKAGKEEKTRIKITDPSFFDKIERLEELNDVMKSAKAKADMISDELRDLAKTEWCSLYSRTSKNPGSVMLDYTKGEDTAQVMVVPSDRYITINEARAEELRETYGEEIVEEKTTFKLDDDMLEKYGEVLSGLIENCSDIDENDKELIIKAVNTFTVAKGTIDKLKVYGDVEEVMEAVKPVVALKNVEVIRG